MKLLRTPPQPVLALLGILLAAAGQYLHVFREANGTAIIFFAGAVFCWIAALLTSPVSIDSRWDQSPSPESRPRSPTRTPIVSALGLALLTFLFGSANGFNSDNVLAWIGSIALFLYAFWLPEKGVVDLWAGFQSRAAALRVMFSQG
ncbi:MAG TPA: hypothetical protein VF478_02360, partial [Anaerolineae bacterium]